MDAATDRVWSRVHVTTWRHLVEERGWTGETGLDRTLSSLARELIT